LYSKLHHVDYAPRLPLQDPPRYSAEWRVPHIAFPLRFAKISGPKYVSNPACLFQSPLPNPHIFGQKKPLKSQSSYPKTYYTSSPSSGLLYGNPGTKTPKTQSAHICPADPTAKTARPPASAA